jgi:hypothetical protein
LDGASGDDFASRAATLIVPEVGAGLAGVGALSVVVIAIVAAASSKGRSHSANASEPSVSQIAGRLDELGGELRSRDDGTDTRLARIEQMLDVLAVETERIGEGQRFITRLLAESQLPSADKPRVRA